MIDLQAQFGNKWAKIATYLSGRTDNDVKNFWSSRQKRLARILQTSSTKSHKNTKEVVKHPSIHNVPLEVTLIILFISNSFDPIEIESKLLDTGESND